MKVLKIEDFPGNEIECKNCSKALLNRGRAVLCMTLGGQSNCPSEGCRPDCPLIPCEGIIEDLLYIKDGQLWTGESIGDCTDDSIKFIKACEDNQ